MQKNGIYDLLEKPDSEIRVRVSLVQELGSVLVKLENQEFLQNQFDTDVPSTLENQEFLQFQRLIMSQQR